MGSRLACRRDRSPDASADPSSTVSREIGRNGSRGGYRALAADAGAFERARRPKVSKLAANRTHPGAAANLRERLDETLTVLRLCAWVYHSPWRAGALDQHHRVDDLRVS